jgi:hypothetical protein
VSSSPPFGKRMAARVRGGEYLDGGSKMDRTTHMDDIVEIWFWVVQHVQGLICLNKIHKRTFYLQRKLNSACMHRRVSVPACVWVSIFW